MSVHLPYNNRMQMKPKIILTEKEEELIEGIRFFRKSKHNPSYELEVYVRDLFEMLLQGELTNEVRA